MEEALLPATKEKESWGTYQYMGRSNSFMPTGSVGTDQVSLEEIRSASVFSASCVYQGQYGGVTSANTYGETGRQLLDEVEIRELLIDYVGHRCLEDCNVYVGTLDTFIEERESTTETEPYLGGKIDGKDKSPELGLWELDLRSEFPLLLVSFHVALVTRSSTWSITKENQMTECNICYGRGLVKCNGKGKLPCVTCGSRGLMKCETCEGRVPQAGAASVPDEVFHKSQRIQLCNIQAYQCTPAFYADSYFLNKFSSDVIAKRAHVPPAARIICERHIISVVPFYIIGVSREVYLKDYYPSKFCWGLCPASSG
ncbi:hypothetical protein MKX03_025729 [Papaver bracteatum]|nr:hypothetical protein MKX03_025729 [Papaver bracteatum]